MTGIKLGGLTTGVEAIDRQHEELLGLAAELEASAEHRANERELNRRLVALIAYVEEHFAAEEKLMAESDYPVRELHGQHHRQFKRDLALIAMSREDEEALQHTSQALVRTLRTWIDKHVHEHDVAFARFYRGARS